MMASLLLKPGILMQHLIKKIDMLNIEFWLEELKTKSPESVIKGVQQDALASCRIIAMQKWRTNPNGQWRAACLSLTKGIKTLEGESNSEEEE